MDSISLPETGPQGQPHTFTQHLPAGTAGGVPNTCVLFRCWPPGDAQEQDSLQHLSLFSQTFVLGGRRLGAGAVRRDAAGSKTIHSFPEIIPLAF